MGRSILPICGRRYIARRKTWPFACLWLWLCAAERVLPADMLVYGASRHTEHLPRAPCKRSCTPLQIHGLRAPKPQNPWTVSYVSPGSCVPTTDPLAAPMHARALPWLQALSQSPSNASKTYTRSQEWSLSAWADLRCALVFSFCSTASKAAADTCVSPLVALLPSADSADSTTSLDTASQSRAMLYLAASTSHLAQTLIFSQHHLSFADHKLPSGCSIVCLQA